MKKKYIPWLILLLILSLFISSCSCSRTTEAPSINIADLPQESENSIDIAPVEEAEAGGKEPAVAAELTSGDPKETGQPASLTPEQLQAIEDRADQLMEFWKGNVGKDGTDGFDYGSIYYTLGGAPDQQKMHKIVQVHFENDAELYVLFLQLLSDTPICPEKGCETFLQAAVRTSSEAGFDYRFCLPQLQNDDVIYPAKDKQGMACEIWATFEGNGQADALTGFHYKDWNLGKFKYNRPGTWRVPNFRETLIETLTQLALTNPAATPKPASTEGSSPEPPAPSPLSFHAEELVGAYTLIDYKRTLKAANGPEESITILRLEKVVEAIDTITIKVEVSYSGNGKGLFTNIDEVWHYSRNLETGEMTKLDPHAGKLGEIEYLKLETDDSIVFSVNFKMDIEGWIYQWEGNNVRYPVTYLMRESYQAGVIFDPEENYWGDITDTMEIIEYYIP